MDATQAVKSLGALAQVTRLAIYRALIQAGGEGLSVGEIGTRVDASGATLSFHLKELVHAGLVDARQDGRFIYYSADYREMQRLLAFLTENCCAREGSLCSTDGNRAPKQGAKAIATRSVKVRRATVR
jgi:ArsR family transcriptional regulator